MNTLNDLISLKKKIHIRLMFLLLLFFACMLVYPIEIRLIIFVIQMLILVYTIKNYTHLSSLKNAIDQANKLKIFYEHGNISSEVFEEIMNDIFHRQNYVLEFKETHDIDKLKQIKELENKKYKGLIHEDEIQGGIRISKKLISRYLEDFFQNIPPLINAKRHFHTINLKIMERKSN